MRTWVRLSVAALTLLALAGVANAGINASATYRLAWGPVGTSQSINSVRHDVSIADTTADTTINLWVTVIGVSGIKGYDLQLALLSDRSFAGQFSLPSAWQFLFDNPCNPGTGLTDNLIITRSGLGTGNLFLLSSNPPTSQVQMSYIDNIWYIWVSSAQATGIARVVGTRYTLARIDMSLTPASLPDCFGAGGPVCIQPHLTQGYNSSIPGYSQVSMALLDNQATPELDFPAAESGFAYVTANYLSPANTNLQGCPAPTAIRSSTWGQLRKLYH